MSKTLWVLVFLFFEIILETGVKLASVIVRGLSVKNALIYGVLVIFFSSLLVGRRRVFDRYIRSTNRLLVWFTLYCASVLLVMRAFPVEGYDWATGVFRFKAGQLDVVACFFIFMYFSDSLKRASNMLTILIMIIGLAALGTLVDMLVPSISLFGVDENTRRPNGAFGEPNQSAAVFSLFLPFVLAKMLGRSNVKILKLVYAGVGVIVLAAIVATGSRGGILGAGTGALLFIWYIKNQLSITNKMLALLAIPFMITAVWFVMPAFFQESLIARFSFLGESGADYHEASAGRTGIWLHAIALWIEKPVFGWGWSGFEIISGGGATHSIYFERLVDTGLIGLTIFVWVLYRLWRCVFDTMKKSAGNERIYLSGLAAGFLGFNVSLVFVNLYTPALIAWSFVGVMIAYANEIRVDRLRRQNSVNKRCANGRDA